MFASPQTDTRALHAFLMLTFLTITEMSVSPRRERIGNQRATGDKAACGRPDGKGNKVFSRTN